MKSIAGKVFLVLALALPPVEKKRQLHLLREYLYNNSPGYSFFFSETVKPPKEWTWEKIGIEFEGVKIWRKKRLFERSS